MNYLAFSLGFLLIHTASYMLAGLLALKISKDLYQEKRRLLDFLRDMSDDTEKRHVEKWFLPAQLIRGLLLSLVLYPVRNSLMDIHFIQRFLFLAGLMLIYTDLASATPFPHNLEGFVYMKSRYVKGAATGKLYLETIIYSSVFGLAAGWFLF